MRGSKVVEGFLRQHGRLGTMHAGPLDATPPSAEELAALRARLDKVVANNAPFVWMILGFVALLSAASFGVAVAVGGSERMAYLSVIATALCIPIGLHLRSLWKDKFRTEVLLELLPLLPKSEWLDALERFFYRDRA